MQMCIFASLFYGFLFSFVFSFLRCDLLLCFYALWFSEICIVVLCDMCLCSLKYASLFFSGNESDVNVAVASTVYMN